MKKLYIVGAGGFGREVLGWALQIQLHTSTDWSVAGFLDSNPHVLDGYGIDWPVLASPEQFVPSPDDVLICAIGNPRVKLRLCELLQERGACFTRLIHPTAIVGLHCQIGVGSILCPHSVLTTNVTVGEHVAVNIGTSIGHDAIIGDGCTLNSHCDVTGGAVLGKGVYLGSHASILPQAQVGDFALVGAGSVVLKRVASHTTVVGVPAKKLAGASGVD